VQKAKNRLHTILLQPCYSAAPFRGESVETVMSPERRKSPRKKTFLKGTVYFNHRRSSIECTIRDFSDYGARLQFAAPVTLPDTVELEVPSREQILKVHVRWRKDDEVGVSMEDANPDSAPELIGTGELSQRVAALEREITKLHKVVMDLRADMRHIRGDD
jgi:hypothetical protein